MNFNRSLLLDIVNHKELVTQHLYKIKTVAKHTVEFEPSTDNNQQNFYFYTNPRPTAFCLFLENHKPKLVEALEKEVTEFETKTNLKIDYVL